MMAQYSITPPLVPRPIPDDAHIQTNMAQICVDYLSHNWAEEDVWKSWRNMTRQKNEINNGIRLENASWRTWWKQRNKLRTISPETLNWLKDSDVTWLYGPLHTAVDSVPPLKLSSPEERLNLVLANGGKKPILKHRSLSEILTIPMPSSPVLEPVPPEFEEEDDIVDDDLPPVRPPFLHTKSDSHIIRSSMARRDSPPRVVAEDGKEETNDRMHPTRAPWKRGKGSDSSTSPMRGTSDQEGSNSGKKHISFNTFVEQCIAIESPRIPDRKASDDEEDDEEEDDDDVLEMRTSSRSNSMSGTTRPTLIRMPSVDRERMTIAPIPPTILKSSGAFPAPSPAVVFMPPPGSPYNGTAVLKYQLATGYGFPSPSAESTSSSQWEDEDDDYSGVGFDYFSGPDFGVGDEYDVHTPHTPASQRSRDGSTSPRYASRKGSKEAIAADGRKRRRGTSPNSSRSSSRSNPASPPGGGGGGGRGRGILKTHRSYDEPPSRDSPPPSQHPSQSASPSVDSALHSAPIGVPSRKAVFTASPPSSESASPATEYLAPPNANGVVERGRTQESGRGRSSLRTASNSLSDRESSSRGTSSPIGSVSPNSSRPSSAMGNRRSSAPASNVSETQPAPARVIRTSGPPKPSSIKTPLGKDRPSLIINHDLVGGESPGGGSASSTHSFPSPGAGAGRGSMDVLPTVASPEEYHSTNPTPLNSPVTTIRPLPGERDNVSIHSTSTSSSSASTVRMAQQEGSLVGRAVEMVASALGWGRRAVSE